MLKRESFLSPWIHRNRIILVVTLLALLVISAPRLDALLFDETLTATNIVATTTLTSHGTTTSDGLIEAKAQIKVDGPAATNSNVLTCNGNPNGSITAAKGSICMDPTTPAVWVNTNAGTTWVQIAPVFTAAAGGAVPASGGGTINFLRADQAWADPTAGISFGFGWFADGSDGALNFDGVSTVTLLGGTTIVPVAGLYTLPRNIHATNLTIAVGATVETNSYIPYATGTATINGTLSHNGKDAPGGNTAGGSLTDNYLPGSSLGGGNGGVNSSGASSAGTGNAGTGCTTGGVTGGAGVGTNGGTCQGGAGGGAGASFIGGNSGNVSLLAPQNGDVHDPWIGWQRIQDNGSVVASVNRWITGTGGGGGGCDGSTLTCQAGGGGGSGGALVAHFHTVAGSGTISAHGGKGGDGDPQGQTGPAGGGGGGSGGYVFLIYVSGTPPTINVSGGAPGLGANGGTNGGTGGTGLQFITKLQ